MHVALARMKSYENTAEIAGFVAAAFALEPKTLEILRSENPEKLIVVKPNWIQEAHEFEPDVWECIITHPNILLAVVEYLASEMGGKGTICVCDAPHGYASFDGILSRGNFAARFKALSQRFPELHLEIVDLRREVWIRKEDVVVERRPNKKDPRGYVRFNLGAESLFYNHPSEGLYYGADYDTHVVNEHHQGDTHEYLIAGSPIKCDLFVNLPKMKTHKKTGITCCLKNLVGINGDKNWLPHHRIGSPEDGGDEFPGRGASRSLETLVKKIGWYLALNAPGGTLVYRKLRNVGVRVLGDSSSVIRNGNWSGNDTCWRMALDLNRCLLHGDSDGELRPKMVPDGRYLAIVDGIIGGDGNGPLCADPVDSQVLIAGSDPACVDAVVCRLMGFDPRLFPIVREAFAPHEFPVSTCQLEDIVVHEQSTGQSCSVDEVQPSVPGGFKPHFGWTMLQEAGKA